MSLKCIWSIDIFPLLLISFIAFDLLIYFLYCLFYADIFPWDKRFIRQYIVIRIINQTNFSKLVIDHYVKYVRMRIFSDPYFSCIREISWTLFLYGKMRVGETLCSGIFFVINFLTSLHQRNVFTWISSLHSETFRDIF